MISRAQRGKLKVLECVSGPIVARSAEILAFKARLWAVSECVFWDRCVSRSVRRVEGFGVTFRVMR